MRNTNIMFVGGGGREDSMAWKARQNSEVGEIFITPGNAGTKQYGKNVSIAVTDVEKLADFAEENKVDLTIVGQEDALAAGIVNLFRARGLRIFGPTREAAKIETSKAFFHEVMARAGVPTAHSQVFTDHLSALAWMRIHKAPVVVKADGLAAGKGAVICKTVQEAERAIASIMIMKAHGDAGKTIVIEEFLEGQELSVHTLCTPSEFYVFPVAQDHKPALEGDKGEMTGGMGTFSPVPWVTAEMMHEIRERIVRPTVEEMKKSSVPFEGLMYHGLMMTSTGPKVLEINARFGDTEAQTFMRKLKTDFVDLINSCVDDKLDPLKVDWNPGFAATIVLASGGYPGKYAKGVPIYDIEDALNVPGVMVFHAGTTYGLDSGLETSGGRVLNISATGRTLTDALRIAYQAADCIKFEGKFYRRDIGRKSLSVALE